MCNAYISKNLINISASATEWGIMEDQLNGKQNPL